jgi:hypothetical protein
VGSKLFLLFLLRLFEELLEYGSNILLDDFSVNASSNAIDFDFLI